MPTLRRPVLLLAATAAVLDALPGPASAFCRKSFRRWRDAETIPVHLNTHLVTAMCSPGS
jgi:hypothetical protein